MPVRIYALAKELKVDSKDLVDLCAKAGVTGKGSALASLTDEEVDRVKAYLSGGAGASRGATRAPATKAVPIINAPSSSPAAPAAAPQAPAVAPAAPPVAPAPISPPSTPAATAPVAPAAPVSPAAPASQPPKRIVASSSSGSPVLTRDSAYSGRNSTREIRVLAPKARKANEAERQGDERKKQPESETPAPIRLAPMPEVKQPPPSQKAKEPAAQKPTIRLPKDAIQSARKGGSGRLDEIREAAEKKRKKDPREATPEKAPPTSKAPAKKDVKGKKKTQEEDESAPGLSGMSSARQARQDQRKLKAILSGQDEETVIRSRRRPKPGKSKVKDMAAPRKEDITLTLPCTVRQFSEAAGVQASTILRKLMEMGHMVNINAIIDLATAEHLALELELNLQLREQESLEDSLLAKVREQIDSEEQLESRPPVVTFLGHVDHGKTSLLDRIIGTDVVSGEAGGITQHIRAYSVKKGERRISFVDTPGHEAFTEMRARGANVTDIAVLVVAADDGVMPQTEEAISHAKAAEVPIVVAMNKIDLPGAKPDLVYQQLSQHGLLPAEWGGDVEVVKTSAITGEGMDALLETLLLTADLHELKANPNRDAFGVCLEAEQEADRGVVAKFMVQNGTLHLGDIVVCGAAHGRVKAMYHTLKGKKLKEAGPSMPVNITGLDSVPEAGESFYVLRDIVQARELAARRGHDRRLHSLSGVTTRVSFEDFQLRLAQGTLGGENQVAVLNLILRADTRGSIEAILKELGKLDHPEVKVKILQASVGGITVGDVTLADASNAVIVGFNVIPDEAARALADERGVEIRRYDIIYRVTSDIKDLLEGKLTPGKEIKELGRALVKQVFTISRVGAIAGCHVLDGVISRGCRIRVNRDGRGIGDYALDSLRREKDDAKEVRKGYECGIKLEGFNDIKEGDILEAYEIQEVKREL